MGENSCKSQGLIICIYWLSTEPTIVKPRLSLLLMAWSASSAIQDEKYQDGQFINVSSVWRSIPIIVTCITCLNGYKDNASPRDWDIIGTQCMLV